MNYDVPMKMQWHEETDQMVGSWSDEKIKLLVVPSHWQAPYCNWQASAQWQVPTL